MKSKFFKSLCLFTFLCITSSSFGQTEQETKSWLQEKLSKYWRRASDSNVEDLSIKVETCNLVINWTWNTHKHEAIVPTDGTFFSPMIETEGERIKDKNLTTNETSYRQSVWFFELPEAEKDLYSRVKKALGHLASFCPKKKETF